MSHLLGHEAFAELGLIKHAETDSGEVLQRISETAKRAIPGALAVSVSLLENGQTSTAVFTDDLARQLDERQYEIGHGPCIDAAEGGVTLLVADMATEDRWPTYTPTAVQAGVGSSMSIPLPVQQAVTGGLNVYAAAPQAFDDEAVSSAERLAGYAAVALANAHAYAGSAALVGQMQEAMASRAVIEQAKGMLMAQHRCSAEEAFDLLCRASQRENRKLRDIATAIVSAAHGDTPA